MIFLSPGGREHNTQQKTKQQKQGEQIQMNYAGLHFFTKNEIVRSIRYLSRLKRVAVPANLSTMDRDSLRTLARRLKRSFTSTKWTTILSRSYRAGVVA